MKKISDLLDDYQEDTIQLTGETPLSPERIKQLTMKKIQVPKRRHLALGKLAAIAAAVSLLTVTAAAAEYVWGVKDWFGPAFNSRADQIRESYERKDVDIQVPENLDLDQLGLLESIGQIKNQSVTSEGATITLTAVCSDEYVMHLYFQVEAPEGTVLPDGLDYNFSKNSSKTINEYHNTTQQIPTIRVNDKTFFAMRSFNVMTMPDADPTDNKKEFHLIMLSSLAGEEDPWVKLNDGQKKTIQLKGLFTCEETNGKQVFQNIVPGEFTFDITNDRPSQWLDVEASGITYEQELDVGKDGTKKTATVEMEILRIGPLGARWESSGYLTLPEIFLKDGSQAVGWTNFARGMVAQDGVMDGSKGYKTFYIPIDVGDVDYIQLGEKRIYVNQEETTFHLPGDMSQGQLDILESMGQVKNETITSNGASITLQAVCSDEYVMHLYFQVEAPEGTVLPNGPTYSFQEPVQGGYYNPRRTSQITVADRKSLGTTDMRLQVQPDADPTDNKKAFILTLYRVPNGNSGSAKFNDSVKKTLNINGLYAYERDAYEFKTDTLEQTFFQGDYDFDITNAVESKRIDVDVKGLTFEYPLRKYVDGKKQPETEMMDITVDSLRIGPLSAEWVGDGMAYLEIYMKDGTKAHSDGGRAMDKDGKWLETRIFYIPIDIGQIDYVLIGGVHKIHPNQ